MTEQQLKKGMFICGAVTVISAVLLLAFMGAMVLSTRGMRGLDALFESEYLVKGITALLSMGTFAPLGVKVYFRLQLQKRTLNDKK